MSICCLLSTDGSRPIRQAEPGRPIRAETHPPLSLPVIEEDIFEIGGIPCDTKPEKTVEKSPVASTSYEFSVKTVVTAEIYEIKDLAEPTITRSSPEQLTEEVIVTQPQRRGTKPEPKKAAKKELPAPKPKRRTKDLLEAEQQKQLAVKQNTKVAKKEFLPGEKNLLAIDKTASITNQRSLTSQTLGLGSGLIHLLANSSLVCSRKLHRDPPAADFEDDRRREDNERRSTETPSPAPNDPELEILRHIYRSFKDFEPTTSHLPYKDPRIIEYLKEREIKLSRSKRSTQRQGRSRRASISEPTVCRVCNLRVQYGTPQSIESVTCKERPLSVDRVPRSFYEEHPPRSLRFRPRTRSFWVPSPDDSITSDTTISREVKNYRRLSARSFLELSPEVPNDLQKLQVGFLFKKLRW